MTGCAHVNCVDDGHVTVQFPGGRTRDYCQFHAQHLGRLNSVEVAQ